MRCKHCGQVLHFKGGKTSYTCENKSCPAYHTSVMVDISFPIDTSQRRWPPRYYLTKDGVYQMVHFQCLREGMKFDNAVKEIHPITRHRRVRFLTYDDIVKRGKPIKETCLICGKE